VLIAANAQPVGAAIGRSKVETANQ